MRAPAKPSPPPPPASRRGAGPRTSTYEVLERIVGLQLRQEPLAVLAGEALPALLGVFAAPAGALLVYHSEDGSLGLAASQELSDAGREALETLRPGAAGGWEIPLHGLINRKAYLIERPYEHPFVPELVDRQHLLAPPNLACIPLYRGPLPVGVLLVIAGRRPVTHDDIMAHVLAYDVLALALDAGLRARGEAPGPLSPPEAEAAALTCEEWVDPRERARQLESDLAVLQAERDRLAVRASELEARHEATTAVLERRVADAERALAAERAGAARHASEREHELAAQLAAVRTAAEGELARVRAAAAETLGAERATAEERLAQARSAAEAALARAAATAGEAERSATATIERLQHALAERSAALSEREHALEDLGAERDRMRQAAIEAGDTIRRLRGEHERADGALAAATEAHAHALAALRAEHERTLASAQAEHEQARAAAEASHREARRALEATHHEALAVLTQARAGADDAATAASRRAEQRGAELAAARTELARLQAEREQVLAAVDDPGAEPAAVIRALREQVAALEGQVDVLTAERTALSRRTAEEQDASARRAAEEREASAARAARERAAFEEQVAAELARVEAARAELAEALAETKTRAERESTALRRAHEETLAAAAATHRRELEERVAVEMRAREDAEAAYHRACAELEEEQRARLAALRASAAEEQAALRAEHEHGRTALRAESERQLAAARGAQTETLARATAAEGRAAALERDLAALRDEVARLGEERARVMAAVEEPDGEPAAVIRTLREQVVTLEGQLGMLARERDAFDERMRADRAALEERLAAVEEARAAAESGRETLERERLAQAARVGALERDLVRSEEMLVSARRQLEDAVRRARAAAAAAGDEPATPKEDGATTASPTPPADTAVAAVAEEASARRPVPPSSVPTLEVAEEAPTEVEVIAPPPAPIVEAGPHRVLEPDPALRERIIAALGSGLQKAPAGAVFVVNLRAVVPARLSELDQATCAGARIVAYLDDAGGRSRILGPMRCLGEPPHSADVVTVIDAMGQGSRRIITLSEDIDAFMAVKTALAKAGHSVSMASDTKQAIDLLGILLAPHAVFVDLRSGAETAAEFLDRLPLESGQVLSFLILGAGDAALLGTTVGRLLRPEALDPEALTRACLAALTGPQTPAPKAKVPARPPVGRPADRPKPPSPRKSARRMLGLRR